MRLEDGADHDFLGLTFPEQVQPPVCHAPPVSSRTGRPPSRFFSHSSPSEYSASHALSESRSGLVNSDARDHDQLVDLELVHQGDRLRGDQYLAAHRGLPEQARQLHAGSG
ncbi:hypothetical protein [Amycolatopsis sulphurea]|uniref:hypothetical protein n=1 Tax=Amycolatopsis sulphurea TaxID=76022 RepID=UPI001B803B74|nr:hypothetical protein [Amycolatopsis sulphurea]